MRARIRKDDVEIEFTGRGQVWNDILRPWVGGPEAPSEADEAPAARPAETSRDVWTSERADLGAARPFPPRTAAIAPSPAPASAGAPAARPVAAAYAAQPAPSAPRTWYPPRMQQPQRQEAPRPAIREDDEEESIVRVEPSGDPATLYARLAALPGRRSERDAVLAAVWFLTKGERETNPDEVEGHFRSLSVFEDVKLVPLLLKHVHRTRMLEAGALPRAVRLSKKGIAHVSDHLVRDDPSGA
jgi:hypothetical protein